MWPRADRRAGRDPADATSDFLDTRPLRDHQERLHSQWGRPRAHYMPNHVPTARRVLIALIGTTWVAWALIGLLSGHMFIWALLVPLHVTGLSAWLLSVAVLVSAAACCVSLVDHVDKRDNEHRYRQARRRLWQAAGALGVASGLVHVGTALDLLPPVPTDLGLVSPMRLQTLLQQPALQRWLAQHHDGIHTWWWVTGVWAFLGLAVFQKLGLMDADGPQAQTFGRFLVVMMAFVMPALATFSLYLLDQLAMGHVAASAEDARELQETTAWYLTLLLTSLGSLTLLLALTVFGAVRQLRPAPLRHISPHQ